MARRCVRATSRLTFCFSEKSTLSSWTCLFGAFVLFGAAAEAELYTSSDQVTLLTPENVKSVLVNSSAATVVEFYAAWCGHCIAFSPIYKSLARDIKGWYELSTAVVVLSSLSAQMNCCVHGSQQFMYAESLKKNRLSTCFETEGFVNALLKAVFPSENSCSVEFWRIFYTRSQPVSLLGPRGQGSDVWFCNGFLQWPKSNLSKSKFVTLFAKSKTTRGRCPQV